MGVALAVLLSLAFSVRTEVILWDRFDSGEEAQWVPARGSGKLVVDRGQSKGDPGLLVTEEERQVTYSRRLPRPCTTTDVPLAVSFSVTHENATRWGLGDWHCAGAYLKLSGAVLDQGEYRTPPPYRLLFGPDVCGPTSEGKILFSFISQGREYVWAKPVRVEIEPTTQFFTLFLTGGSYEVWVDDSIKRRGRLEEDFDCGAGVPRWVPDPEASKPLDWADRFIPDPSQVKPIGWDAEPEMIPDEGATKPTEWDTEEDGEWAPPMLPNPLFKGDWKPDLVPNPRYVGDWKAPLIVNPLCSGGDPEGFWQQRGLESVAIDVWQTQSGAIFDNIMVATGPEALTNFRGYQHALATERQARAEKLRLQDGELKEAYRLVAMEEEKHVRVRRTHRGPQS